MKYTESSQVGGLVSPGELELAPCCTAKPPIGPAGASDATSMQILLPELMPAPTDQSKTPWAALSIPGLLQLNARTVLSRHGCQLGARKLI